MRRADDRRSASVMIKSSIRWSLVGNDVDWMMKASEPRTFSWISTKISMSAKRRTTALASCRPSPWAISCASAGLELPATSLIEPFLADIDASCLALLDTTFSISRYPRVRRVSMARRYQAGACAGNPLPRFSRSKMPRKSPGLGLLRVVGEGADTRLHAGDRGAAPAVGRGRGRHVGRAIDHARQPAEAGLRDLAQHQVVGGRPGVTPGFAGGLFAGQAQRALLAAVIDVPHPGDHGAAAHHLRRQIAAHGI